MQCLICHLEFKDMRSVMKHVHFKHKTYTTKTYYDEFLRSDGEGICECGTETTFRGAGQGYLEFCSHTCFANSEKTRVNMSVKASGKKQSDLTIRKRIANTDQLSKEERRKSTCLERHGVEHPSQIPDVAAKISLSNRGKPKIRSLEHSAKIAESRKISGANKHSDVTKKKISNSIKSSKKFQARKDDGTFVNASKIANGRTLCGKFNGMHFRSSYELAFLIEMHVLGILVEPADNKKFSCKYKNVDEREASYYPDFFLPETGSIIEIKNSRLCTLQSNILKFDAARKKYGLSFKVLTEADLVDITGIVNNPTIRQHLEVLKNEHLCLESRSGLGGKRLL